MRIRADGSRGSRASASLPVESVASCAPQSAPAPPARLATDVVVLGHAGVAPAGIRPRAPGSRCAKAARSSCRRARSELGQCCSYSSWHSASAAASVVRACASSASDTPRRGRCAERAPSSASTFQDFASAEPHGQLRRATGGLGVAGAAMFERRLRVQLAFGVVVGGLGGLLAPRGAIFVTAAGDPLVEARGERCPPAAPRSHLRGDWRRAPDRSRPRAALRAPGRARFRPCLRSARAAPAANRAAARGRRGRAPAARRVGGSVTATAALRPPCATARRSARRPRVRVAARLRAGRAPPWVGSPAASAAPLSRRTVASRSAPCNSARARLRGARASRLVGGRVALARRAAVAPDELLDQRAGEAFVAGASAYRHRRACWMARSSDGACLSVVSEA